MAYAGMEKITRMEHRLCSSVYGGNTQKELDSRLLFPLPSPNSKVLPSSVTLTFQLGEV